MSVDTVDLLKALAHPFRLELVSILRSGEACVCHLEHATGRSQPYVSKHLAALREAGLLWDRKDGLRVYYRLVDPSVGSVVDAADLALIRVGPGEGLPRRAGPTTPLADCPCPRCVSEREG